MYGQGPSSEGLQKHFLTEDNYLIQSNIHLINTNIPLNVNCRSVCYLDLIATMLLSLLFRSQYDMIISDRRLKSIVETESHCNR